MFSKITLYGIVRKIHQISAKIIKQEIRAYIMFVMIGVRSEEI